MLITKTREKLLNVFFKDPEIEVHLREIARQAKVAPHNANKYLKEFITEGLLQRRNAGNMTFYKVNPQNDYLFNVFEMFEISRRTNFFNHNKKIARLLSEYSENLIRLSGREIQMVILFGSVSRGEWTKRSDIDVLTVTAFKTDRKNIIQVHEKAKDTAATLLNISAVNVSLNKFTEGIRNKLEFYEELWRDRIILYNEFLFWQLIKKAKLVND